MLPEHQLFLLVEAFGFQPDLYNINLKRKKKNDKTNFVRTALSMFVDKFRINIKKYLDHELQEIHRVVFVENKICCMNDEHKAL